MKNRIKVLRAERNMTQEQLAELAGVTRNTIISTEKDKYCPSLTRGTVLHTCSALELTRYSPTKRIKTVPPLMTNKVTLAPDQPDPARAGKCRRFLPGRCQKGFWEFLMR